MRQINRSMGPFTLLVNVIVTLNRLLISPHILHALSVEKNSNNIQLHGTTASGQSAWRVSNFRILLHRSMIFILYTAGRCGNIASSIYKFLKNIDVNHKPTHILIR